MTYLYLFRLQHFDKKEIILLCQITNTKQISYETLIISYETCRTCNVFIRKIMRFEKMFSYKRSKSTKSHKMDRPVCVSFAKSVS